MRRKKTKAHRKACILFFLPHVGPLYPFVPSQVTSPEQKLDCWARSGDLSLDEPLNMPVKGCVVLVS